MSHSIFLSCRVRGLYEFCNLFHVSLRSSVHTELSIPKFQRFLPSSSLKLFRVWYECPKSKCSSEMGLCALTLYNYSSSQLILNKITLREWIVILNTQQKILCRPFLHGICSVILFLSCPMILKITPSSYYFRVLACSLLSTLPCKQGEDSLWYSVRISLLPFKNPPVAFLNTFLTGDNCCEMSLKPFYEEWSATLSFLESEQKDFFSALDRITISSCLFNSLITID